jgi:ABC-type Mn2+/Zn2+ transport system ATPase subunit
MQSSLSRGLPDFPLEEGSINIQLTNAGKRFSLDWIFRHINYTFEQGRSYAITGPNGSGKSTLLQIIAGAITPSEGTVEYRRKKKQTGTWESGIGNKGRK